MIALHCWNADWGRAGPLRLTASAIGSQLEVLTARTSREIDAAYADLLKARIDAVVVGAHGLFNQRRLQLVTLATRHAVPAIYA
jgi:putative ABC transport system substrate-binding protein